MRVDVVDVVDVVEVIVYFIGGLCLSVWLVILVMSVMFPYAI